MIRIVSSFAAASLFSILFLFALKSSIEVKSADLQNSDNLRFIEFVRLKREDRLDKKERVKPEKPKPRKQPPKPRVDIPKPNQPDKTRHNILQLQRMNLPVNLSATSALGDALVTGFGGRAVNANVIPLARINPIYPKRARMMKKEGFVKLEFTITEAGTVKDVDIIESQPPRLFDHSAKRALVKWKFKPRVENNQMVAQRASVQIVFKLD